MFLLWTAQLVSHVQAENKALTRARESKAKEAREEKAAFDAMGTAFEASLRAHMEGEMEGIKTVMAIKAEDKARVVATYKLERQRTADNLTKEAARKRSAQVKPLSLLISPRHPSPSQLLSPPPLSCALLHCPGFVVVVVIAQARVVLAKAQKWSPVALGLFLALVILLQAMTAAEPPATPVVSPQRKICVAPRFCLNLPK